MKHAIRKQVKDCKSLKGLLHIYTDITKNNIYIKCGYDIGFIYIYTHGKLIYTYIQVKGTVFHGS